MNPEALAALHARASAPERPWTAAEFAALVAGPGTLLTGSPASFVLGRVVVDEAEVLTLATDPDRRRQGLARAALATFEHEAAVRGAGRVVLEVAEDNAPARALYAGRGYVSIGRRPRYYDRFGAAPAAALVLARALP